MISYVEDSLNAGTLAFERLSESMLIELDSKPRLYDTFDFYSSQIHTLKQG